MSWWAECGVDADIAEDLESRGRTDVLPVYLKECDRQDTAIDRVGRVPANKPITKYENEDEAWVEVSKTARAWAQKVITDIMER